jgi:hypothetical protein
MTIKTTMMVGVLLFASLTLWAEDEHRLYFSMVEGHPHGICEMNVRGARLTIYIETAPSGAKRRVFRQHGLPGSRTGEVYDCHDGNYICFEPAPLERLACKHFDEANGVQVCVFESGYSCAYEALLRVCSRYAGEDTCRE